MFCGNQEEDTAHSPFYYTELTQWWLRFLPQLQQAPANLSFLELVEWFMNHGGLKELPNLFTMAWSLWKRRNKRIFEETTLSPKATIEGALFYIHFARDYFKSTSSE